MSFRFVPTPLDTPLGLPEPRDGGLDLRTDGGLQKGGSGGKVVVAHDPKASRLYRAVMQVFLQRIEARKLAGVAA